MPRVLLDFAVEYSMYSRHFVELVEMAVDRLDTKSDTYETLMENIHEEKGEVEEEAHEVLKEAGIELEWIEGITHKQLFLNVKNALARESGLESIPNAEETGPGATFYAVMRKLCVCASSPFGMILDEPRSQTFR